MEKWIRHPNFLIDLRAFQERTGKNQDEIALALGVSVYTLRNWVTGYKVPGFPRKKALAEMFGVHVSRYEDIPDPTAEPLGAVAQFQVDQVQEILADPRFNDADRQELVNELRAKAVWMLNVKARG